RGPRLGELLVRHSVAVLPVVVDVGLGCLPADDLCGQCRLARRGRAHRIVAPDIDPEDSMADQSNGALAGLRVLDISTFFAAPQISAILGDFGADVVKVEPLAGEASRKIGAQRKGASLMWALASRNKRTITLNLDDARGRDILRELVQQVDVIVENYPAAQLAEWGLSYADLS